MYYCLKRVVLERYKLKKEIIEIRKKIKPTNYYNLSIEASTPDYDH